MPLPASLRATRPRTRRRKAAGGAHAARRHPMEGRRSVVRGGGGRTPRSCIRPRTASSSFPRHASSSLTERPHQMLPNAPVRAFRPSHPEPSITCSGRASVTPGCGNPPCSLFECRRKLSRPATFERWGWALRAVTLRQSASLSRRTFYRASYVAFLERGQESRLVAIGQTRLSGKVGSRRWTHHQSSGQRNQSVIPGNRATTTMAAIKAMNAGSPSRRCSGRARRSPPRRRTG